MILVTGATGHVGRAVVARLVSLGHDVVAIGETDVGLSFASPAFRARLRHGTRRDDLAMRISQRVC